MSSPKPPKAAAVAAAPRQSAIDVTRAQYESAEELMRRRGALSTIRAGETGYASSVLG